MFVCFCFTVHVPHNRAFTVTYEPGRADVSGLHTHWDNAEMTANVALDGDYEGGELVFSGMKTEPEAPEGQRFGYEHRRGRGVLHPGALRHEALPVETGRRTNFVVWMRSSEERSKECPRYLTQEKEKKKKRKKVDSLQCAVHTRVWRL